ncbi:hypothetical protein TSAR_001133 [Trichomalopsis sarcophagae]|uniref:Uncharacterized protein n=1 Tax=Trichomalopsis sarcophagae TaxID=543379 RepID=A0A232EF40_9HYME|nr:hypothetical protein TSAR_001133 [Trichomalopsis sarcophagae]
MFTHWLLRNSLNISHRYLMAIGLGVVDLMSSFAVDTGYTLCDLQLAQVLISSRHYHTYDCVMHTVTRV